MQTCFSNSTLIFSIHIRFHLYSQTLSHKSKPLNVYIEWLDPIILNIIFIQFNDILRFDKNTNQSPLNHTIKHTDDNIIIILSTKKKLADEDAPSLHRSVSQQLTCTSIGGLIHKGTPIRTILPNPDATCLEKHQINRIINMTMGKQYCY